MGSSGRPPDLENRRAVLEATRQLLAEVGYSALTIDGVAKRAELYRLLIYRTWETKQALVVDALFGDTPGFETTDTGALVTDLRAFVAAHSAIITRPAHLRGLPGLTVELRADRTLYKSVWSTYVIPVETELKRIVTRALERGELRAPVDVPALNAAMTGMIQMLAAPGYMAGDQLVDYVTQFCLTGVLGPD